MVLVYSLIAINVLGFVLEIFSSRRPKDKEKSPWDVVLAIISLLGGAAGVFVSSLIFSWHTEKKNVFIKLFSLCILLLQIMLLSVFYLIEPPYTFNIFSFFKEHIWVLIFILLMSLVSFSLFGLDKSFAKKGKRRISIVSLLLSAALGGSIGSILGMIVFKHKTQKSYFNIGVPLILVVQAMLLFIAMNVA